MDLCRLKIGPRDPRHPTDGLNIKIEINGRECKVHKIKINMDCEDPDDPIAMIELPVSLDVDMQAVQKHSIPAKAEKPERVAPQWPCASCGYEIVGTRGVFRGAMYCQSCFDKVAAHAKRHPAAAAPIGNGVVEDVDGETV